MSNGIFSILFFEDQKYNKLLRFCRTKKISQEMCFKEYQKDNERIKVIVNTDQNICVIKKETNIRNYLVNENIIISYYNTEFLTHFDKSEDTVPSCYTKIELFFNMKNDFFLCKIYIHEKKGFKKFYSISSTDSAPNPL